MASTKAKLRQRLDELASEADKQTRLQDSATRLLYTGLAELYLSLIHISEPTRPY